MYQESVKKINQAARNCLILVSFEGFYLIDGGLLLSAKGLEQEKHVCPDD